MGSHDESFFEKNFDVVIGRTLAAVMLKCTSYVHFARGEKGALAYVILKCKFNLHLRHGDGFGSEQPFQIWKG